MWQQWIKLGISPIGWSNDDLPELGGDIPFERCIAEMSQAGFTGTEVGSRYPKDPLQLKAQLTAHHLIIASQWFSGFLVAEENYAQTIERFEKHLRFLHNFDVKVVVFSDQTYSVQQDQTHPIFVKKPQLKVSEWDHLATGLELCADHAAKYGMKLVYHHHMGTTVQTPEEVDQLMESTDPKKVFLTADTGHFYYAGGDPINLFRKHLPRIEHIHFKDIRPQILKKTRASKLSFLHSVIEGVFTVPGDGIIDFKPLSKMILESDYHGWIIVEAEQDPAKAPPLQYAKKAYAYLNKCLSS